MNSTGLAEDTNGIEEIASIVTKDLIPILAEMTSQSRAIFLITVLNIITRISAFDKSGIVIAGKMFKSMFSTLFNCLLGIVYDKNGDYQKYASDMIDLILMNLAQDMLVEQCFERLLANNKTSTTNPNTTTEPSAKDENKSFRNLITVYMEFASGFATEAVIQSADEFETKYSSVMKSLLNFINKCLIDSNESAFSVVQDAIGSILSLIWNLTSKIALVPMFVNVRCVENIVEWIGKDIFRSNIPKLGEPIFAIVHNLSRHKKGLTELRRKKAFDIIMKCQLLVNQANKKYITQLFGTSLIILSTNDHVQEENKKLMLQISRNWYKWSQKCVKTDDLMYDGYSLSELFALLQRAFSITFIMKDILGNKSDVAEKSTQSFTKMFSSIYGVLFDEEADDLEKSAAKSLLRILLRISYHKQYKKYLVGDDAFCVTIQSIAKRPKQDVAKRICCNLQLKLPQDESKIAASSMIYISYNWTDEEFCKNFVNALSGSISVIPIWVDYERMELWDDMREYSFQVIESATIVVVIMSTAYAASKTSYKELNYAIEAAKNSTTNKKIIIVEAEPKFKCHRSRMSGWLKENVVISYDDNIGNMVSRVHECIERSNNAQITCLPLINTQSQVCSIT
ncbi:unnamed protein product [Rotaria socialis]|uniref:TIR domain-containing protein n=1 Tax=Rotaria socialis TaxID=392032 RepID=A0A820SFE1_9BILA|nr:unnamed protein product [Rotaria socialis]